MPDDDFPNHHANGKATATRRTAKMTTRSDWRAARRRHDPMIEPLATSTTLRGADASRVLLVPMCEGCHEPHHRYRQTAQSRANIRLRWSRLPKSPHCVGNRHPLIVMFDERHCQRHERKFCAVPVTTQNFRNGTDTYAASWKFCATAVMAQKFLPVRSHPLIGRIATFTICGMSGCSPLPRHGTSGTPGEFDMWRN